MLALWCNHTCSVTWSYLLCKVIMLAVGHVWHDHTCYVTWWYLLCDVILAVWHNYAMWDMIMLAVWRHTRCVTWSCLLCDVILAVWHNYAMWDMIMLAARNVHASCRTVALRKKFCWQTWELQCHYSKNSIFIAQKKLRTVWTSFGSKCRWQTWAGEFQADSDL